MKAVIGIDLGTSGCKVLAIDQSGRIITDTIEEYPCFFPAPGWSQQNPEDWFNAVVKGLKTVSSGIPGYEISAVGFSGQMHGMVALDESNEVIRPAILWNDQRTKEQCAEITAAAGGLEKLLEMTDNQMITGFTAGKIVWLKKNEPENYKRVRHILNPKDYIRFRLTGEYITDVSEASGTGLFDVKNRCWSTGLMNKLGISPSWFPSVVESVEKAGFVTDAAAKLTGLPGGCVCSGGGGDAVISTTGLGLVIPGRVGITVGTSGVVAMGLPGYVYNKGGRMQLSCGNAPGSYHIMGAMLSAAGAYSWFADTFGGEEKILEKSGGDNVFKALDKKAAEVNAGSDGLLFLPYLMGERCPVYDADARGGFFGLNMLHKKGHFARAVMEGVAFSLKQVYDEITSLCSVSPSEIVLAGGGAASPLWRKIFAGVFDLPVRTVFGSKQGGSFAAALVAGVTCGMFDSIEQTMGFITNLTEDMPDKSETEIYKEQYKKFCGLYEATRWMWK